MPLENENLREVVIKTSHNSFDRVQKCLLVEIFKGISAFQLILLNSIPKLKAWGSRQLKGIAASKALVSCLEQKARAIELDIWWHSPRKWFVVAHGLPASHPVSQCMPKIGYKKNIYVTNRLKIDEALGAVKEGAFKTTDLPLFVFLDIGWINNDKPKSKERYQQLADKLNGTFGDMILQRDQFSFDTPLVQYKNKIIFIPATDISGVEEFDRISCFSQIAHPFKNLSEPEYHREKKNITGEHVCRIFPHDVLYSGNYNPLPLLQDGVTFAALDLCTKDKTRADVERLNVVFKEEGIIPINEAKALIEEHAKQNASQKPQDKSKGKQQQASQNDQQQVQVNQGTSQAQQFSEQKQENLPEGQGEGQDITGQSKV